MRWIKRQTVKKARRQGRRPRDQRGISLPELIVTIVMIGMMTGIITGYTISYWRYGYSLQADLDTLGTRLNAGDFLRNQLAPSTGMIIQNSLPDDNVLNVDPADGTGQHWIPLHAIPGNIPMPAAGATTTLVAFQRISFDTNDDYIMNGEQPYEDEFVLYLDGTTKSLRQRSLANPSATDNKLKTSCPPAIASSTCPADKIIATDLASIDMRYFSRSGVPIDYTSIIDDITGNYIGPDFPVVEVIEFNLNLSKKPLLQTSNSISNSTIIRIALRNE
jgi:hypothetical protein